MDEQLDGLYVGCHLSVSNGYEAMGTAALGLGATTFAFFTRNPRGGGARPVDKQDMASLRQLLDDHHFGKLVAHAPYTMNLCSSKPETVSFARRSMAEDLERLELLPGNYYNFHPGSHVKQGADEGIRLICEGLNEVLVPGQATNVLLETMAGKGSEVGRSFEELAQIMDGVKHDELMGVCLDTCHVWDAGYDIREGLDDVLDEFDRVVGIERLSALHLNDSKNPRGSHKDRHERLGEGTLGIDVFAQIVNHPKLRHLPMVLETPQDLDGYGREITLLRSLADTEQVR
ncbi:MAG: deoxyribonuclease IV [Atopobiaceae bacterium]|nr:deoxyribonuclease IV [Atopobiaceae bacterium]